MGWIANQFRGRGQAALERILGAMEPREQRMDASPFARHDAMRLCVAISREATHVARRANRNFAPSVDKMMNNRRTKEGRNDQDMLRYGAAFVSDYGVHNLLAGGVPVDRDLRLKMVRLRFMDRFLPPVYLSGDPFYAAANAGCAALTRLADALEAAGKDVRIRYALEKAQKTPDPSAYIRHLAAEGGVEARMLCSIHHDGRNALKSIPIIARYASGIDSMSLRTDALRCLAEILARILRHGDIPLWNDTRQTIADVVRPIIETLPITIGDYPEEAT